MLIDTHCHLTHWSGMDLEGVIERARLAGVEKIIVPASNLKDSEKVVQLIKDHHNVWAAVGIHPEGVDKFNILDINKLREIAKDKNVVAIGEIGLDKYYNDKNLEKQTEVFSRQLDLAVELDKPVIIHNRLALREIREVFDTMALLPRGVMHCFSGDGEWLDYVVAKGFYISFAGNVTYKSAGNLREMLKKVPPDRLMLETDAPYLPPEGKRGTTNEPENVKITAQVVAEELKISFESLADLSTKNALCLFRNIL